MKVKKEVISNITITILVLGKGNEEKYQKQYLLFSIPPIFQRSSKVFITKILNYLSY